jgi:hypothetical protein
MGTGGHSMGRISLCARVQYIRGPFLSIFFSRLGVILIQVPQLMICVLIQGAGDRITRGLPEHDISFNAAEKLWNIFV